MSGLPDINYFDSGDFHAWFENLECPHCGGFGAIGMIPGKGPHFGAVECIECGRHLQWLPMPKQIQDAKARRQYRRPSLPPDDDYCVFCNIDAAFAKKIGRRMEWIHPRDRAALIDAGQPPDDDTLIRCCSDCHLDADTSRRRVDRIRRAMDPYQGEAAL